MPRPRGAELSAQARQFEDGDEAENLETGLPELGSETEAM